MATQTRAFRSVGAAARAVASAAVAGVVIVGAILVVPSAATAAAPKQCRVKNKTQDTWFATDSGLALTRALEQAANGDRLNVFGRCRGAYSLDKDLTVAGTTDRTNPTVLDGSVTPNRPVVGVPDWATVTLDRLVITGGDVTTTVGAGILNGGDLTLNRSVVVGNRSVMEGGGIFNYGDLVLNHSRLSHNRAGVGGGLFNEGYATLNNSRVTFNTADFDGGVGDVNTLILNNTVIAHNTPNDCSSCEYLPVAGS